MFIMFDMWPIKKENNDIHNQFVTAKISSLDNNLFCWNMCFFNDTSNGFMRNEKMPKFEKQW